MAEEGDDNPHLEVIEYRGFQLTIRQTPLDWLVFIPLPGGQPVIVAGHDKDNALALATAWVDENAPDNGSPGAEGRE